MSKGIVLVNSSELSNSKLIIKGIIKSKTEIKPTEIVDNVEKYSWEIVNKYYTADVIFCPINEPSSVDAQMNDSVEAIILYIPNSKGEKLSEISKWEHVLTKWDCDIKILLCDQCDDNFKHEDVIKWCLDNNFELIELNKCEKNENETCGFDYVIERLHSHVWTNYKRTNDGFNFKNSNYEDKEENEVYEYMDEFTKIFSSMSTLQSTAASMSTDKRKEFAEQVVSAFWKAIGGDESELEDIN